MRKLFITTAILCAVKLSFAQEPVDKPVKVTEPGEQQKAKQIESPKYDSGDEVFTVVQEMPVFPEGDVLTYINSKNSLPREKKVDQTVWVAFIVGKDGKVSNVKIIKNAMNRPDMDAEALRIVKALPDWQPGKQRGQPVNISFTVPVKFWPIEPKSKKKRKKK